jgi:hypothetical protein
MITVSQTAINAVVRDIQAMQETGVVPEYVQQFWASRSEEETEEEQDEQEDKQAA